MYEIIYFVVFLLAGSGLPPGNYEGPFILPGFATLQSCVEHADLTVEDYAGSEAERHRVPPESVIVFHACRRSTAGRGV